MRRILTSTNVGRGMAGGTIIGGGRGAAIGAATCAIVRSHQRRNWHSHYCWRQGGCWVRTSSGLSADPITIAASIGVRHVGFLLLFDEVRTRMTRLLGVKAVFALFCAVASPARADAFRVGRLLCFSTPRVGLVLGSTQSLRCVFYARGSSRRYIHEGRISRIGLDIGVTGGGTLSWAVFARNSQIGPGTMRGTAARDFGPSFFNDRWVRVSL